MGNEPEIVTTDEKSAYAKIKQMKSTSIKSTFKKYGNLPLKVNGLPSFIHKSKELMKN